MSPPTSRHQDLKTRGFVLVNALVLVAAFAAAAVWLLGRAEQGRLRQSHSQTSAQTLLYLDSVEALALTLLRQDQQGGAVDGPGDSWARMGRSSPGGARAPALTLDRGLGQGQISDLQGRFNINWLANPSDILAQDGFARLTRQLGLADRVASQITDLLRATPNTGSEPAQPLSRAQPPIAPRGGPVLLVEQLAMLPGLSRRDLARLTPHIAALPSDSTLNVNTATPQVLASLLPGTTAAGLAPLLQTRQRAPFLSLEEFMTRAARQYGAALPPEGIAETDQPRFGVGSRWFHVDTVVTLDTHSLSRQTIIHRRPLPHGPQVAWRLETRR